MRNLLNKFWLPVGLLLVGVVAGWFIASKQPTSPQGGVHAGNVGHSDHADGHGNHSHAGHSNATSIELTAQGLKNIGFRPLTIQIGDYTRSITVPGIVVERHGRSQLDVTAPLTGVVENVRVIEGEAIRPQTPLFDIRLTHEELVESQREFLHTIEELDVVKSEIKRLESIGEGVIAGKRILEQKYEEQKLSAVLKARHQGLLLHGLSEKQIERIVSQRELLQRMTIYAPAHIDEPEYCREDHLFHIQQLIVRPGQQVEAGEQLAVLADHCELYLEGKAFAEDAARLRETAEKHWEVSAHPMSADRKSETVPGLKVLYLSDRVETDSRAFHLYVRLPNRVVLDQDSGGHRFIQWQFKPGERMDLEVPVERWTKRIVVPVDAVVDEGAENYVYQQNGGHFDRLAVHVEYRDDQFAVIENDGALYPGDVIAARGAYQMHLALKNQMGGGIDPHAGHNH